MIGFIGIGNMGSHMAGNLAKNGFRLVTFDKNLEANNFSKNLGAELVSSPSEVAKKCSVIFSMLPAGSDVREVYTNNNGILSSISPNSILIDCSTCEPELSQHLSTLANEKQATFLDSPVSGGVLSAREAKLTFMVGGPIETLNTVKNILLMMGKNVIHCGAVGMGETAKICNNMMLAISMIGTAETMQLGIALGIDPKVLTKVLNASSGRTWPSEVYNPCPGINEGVPSNNNYEGGFSTGLMSKDLSLSQSLASKHGIITSLGSLSMLIYRTLCKKGYKNLDFSSIFKYID